MERVCVISTNVAEIGHDHVALVLEVVFNSGGVYRYSPVSSVAYAEILGSGSIGRAVNELKRNPDITCERLEAAVS